MILVGSIPVSASVGIRTVSISTRARCRTGRQPHAQVQTTGMPACLRRNDRSVANSRGRKLYRVSFSAQERRDLKAIGHRGRLAQVLMLRSARLVDADIALGTATVERLRRVLEGPEAALSRKEQVNRRPKRGRWRRSWSRPRPRAVDAARRPSGGDRRAHFGRDGQEDAQKKEIKPWLNWCIPPHRSAQFVAADVLDIYQRDFAGDEVLVCETSRQQTKETPRPPVSRRWSTMNMSTTVRPTSSWPLRPTRTGAR